MFGRALDQLTAADIAALIANSTPEGPRLEFKREIDLQTEKGKKEIAKDVSALANALGGRLFIGVEERETDDSSVAHGLSPVSDESTEGRLEDVLASRIEPRPRFYARSVPVVGGFVLVLDIQSSAGVDLHMSGGRFYRRGDRKSQIMTEAEVREAYVRIAERRASLDARVQTSVRAELDYRRPAAQSVVVVPLFGPANLVDPRRIANAFWTALAEGELGGTMLSEPLRKIRIVHDGFRAEAQGTTGTYVAVLKNGLVHVATDGAFYHPSNPGAYVFQSLAAAFRILATLVLAHSVLRSTRYRGPVQVLHRIRPARKWCMDTSPIKNEILPAEVMAPVVDEVDLDVHLGRWGWIVNELLDPIFHASGGVDCGLFTHAGEARREVAADFSRFADVVRPEPQKVRA